MAQPGDSAADDKNVASKINPSHRRQFKAIFPPKQGRLAIGRKDELGPKNFISEGVSRYNARPLGISGSLAQPVEQRTFNPLVASSNLARPTIIIKKIIPFLVSYLLTDGTLVPNISQL